MRVNTPVGIHKEIIEFIQRNGPQNIGGLSKYLGKSRGHVVELITSMSYEYDKLWEDDGGHIHWGGEGP